MEGWPSEGSERACPAPHAHTLASSLRCSCQDVSARVRRRCYRLRWRSLPSCLMPAAAAADDDDACTHDACRTNCPRPIMTAGDPDNRSQSRSLSLSFALSFSFPFLSSSVSLSLLSSCTGSSVCVCACAAKAAACIDGLISQAHTHKVLYSLPAISSADRDVS